VSRERGEFGFIANSLAPLAHHDASLGLTDDAAMLQPGTHPLVITKDMLVKGVHFRKHDPLDLVAEKALAVNLSDLAAKGARPLGYFLAVSFPKDWEDEDRAALISGFARGQERWGVSLLGGDTTSTPGRLALSITALGEACHGPMIRRNGAKPGDEVWVTGTIGDAALALSHDHPALQARYLKPCPRIAFGQNLVGLASAAIDVSDGLVADAGHIAAQSGAELALDLDRVPLSPTVRAITQDAPQSMDAVMGGGDDYEILFTAAPDKAMALSMISVMTATPVTRIGLVKAGGGVTLTIKGEPFGLKNRGYQHF